MRKLNQVWVFRDAKFKGRANAVCGVPRGSWGEADRCFHSEAKRKSGEEWLIKSRWNAWGPSPLFIVPAPKVGAGRASLTVETGNIILPSKDRQGQGT